MPYSLHAHEFRRMDAYVVGAANAGKSSFINYCLKKAPGKEGALTTSHLPGTTLGVVRVSVMAGQYALFDTPGIIMPTQVGRCGRQVSSVHAPCPCSWMASPALFMNDSQLHTRIPQEEC